MTTITVDGFVGPQYSAQIVRPCTDVPIALIEPGKGPFNPGSPAAIESQTPVGYSTGGGGGGATTTLRPRTAGLCATAPAEMFDHWVEVDCPATSVHDVITDMRETASTAKTRRAR